MERLTNHFDYCKMIECKYYDEELHKQNKCKFFDVDISHCHEKSMNDKLREYEDAEEQGLLLRLPCKVGDKAYYVHKGGIDIVEVVSFIININIFVNVNCCGFGITLTPYKTLFFAREEAEKALERMEGNAEAINCKTKEK